ncbi:MAG: DMT family transporter [Candidatus Diapherotrites archaeon]|uniref:DMT family transporter n=1 Tax=Candidatus Iainarchaeum sp. TaxID=3101447 RepID=A0A8T3YQF5_9ARCH|nr:DMT family transporter [Candidatus Diapherotrites archaeon]
MEARRLAVIVLAFAALAWAVSGISYKYFADAGITFITLFAVTRVFKLIAVYASLRAGKAAKEPIKNWPEALLIILNGIFSTTTPVLFILALNYTTLSNTYFLHYTMPAWVMIFAVSFLGERMSARKAAAIAIMAAGVFMIARPDASQAVNMGAMLAIASAISYTGDVVTARELRDYSYHTVTLYTNVIQVIALVPLMLILGLPSAGTLDIAALAIIGAMLGAASYAYYFALEKIEASAAALVNLLELFFAAALAFFLLGEAPHASDAAGYALILSAILIIVLRKSDIENFERLLHFPKKH